MEAEGGKDPAAAPKRNAPVNIIGASFRPAAGRSEIIRSHFRDKPGESDESMPACRRFGH
jgi:hypothetical protein